MIKFGDLTIVDKTFSRVAGATREQAYDGMKFRRFDSNKGKKEAEADNQPFTPFVEEQFIISKKLWEDLSLDIFAFTQIKGTNLIMVLEDQDEVYPPAKFLRTSLDKAGNKKQKGKMFSNEFLVEALIAAGTLKAEVKGNQFITFVNVTSEVSDLPSHVKGVYQLVVDTTVSEEAADAEEKAATSEAEAEFN